MRLHLRDKVILPAGLRVGMGRLREDTAGVVDSIEQDGNGHPIYGVSFRSKKRGKNVERHTWVKADDILVA